MKLYIICLPFLLTACSAIAVRHPVKNVNVDSMTIDWCVTSTSNMNIINKTLSAQQNKIEFDKRIQLALQDIEGKFISTQQELNGLAINKLENCVPKNTSNKNPFELSLRIDLSGYGSIKDEWKKWLIGTGVVESIFQGLLVGSATQNTGLGLAVAAEEMTSEYLTWNGVDWIMGETYAPVTLEGELTYMKSNIWEDSFFITENNDELKKDEKKDKSKQLIASLHKAEKKLFTSLTDYIRSEIIHPDN